LPFSININNLEKGITMALISPGVEVTIVDESQYIPAATNSVPYILLATAQNKASAAGTGVAPGTLAANANKTYLITSQRDLAATFGNPFFYKTTTGTPINGYELNEYGLLAAYSALGVSNRCYVQRVDIDLSELTASLTRPTGAPDNGTYWLDTASSTWGLFEWNQTTGAFTNKVPLVLTSSTQFDTNTGIPLQTVGSIGDYAITAGSVLNPGYYKRNGPTASQTTATFGGSPFSDLYNTWVLIGSDEWKTSWPTITGTLGPATLTAGNTILLNDTPVAVPASPNNTVAGLADAINASGLNSSGIYAATIGGKLYIYADSTATNDGSTGGGGVVAIDNGVGTPLTSLGITSGEYYAPEYYHSPSYSVPRWRTTDTNPQPTGSVWQKINNVNLGMNLVVKKYSSTLGAFVTQACPIYMSPWNALYNLDPSGGGVNIPVGTTYAEIDALESAESTTYLVERYALGATNVTGDDTTPGPFISGNSFTIEASQAGTAATNTGTATLAGTTAEDFVEAVSAANVPYVSASINSAGAIVFTHSQGGTILVSNVTGNAIAAAGFNVNIRGVIQAWSGGIADGLYLANFDGGPTFAYTASDVAPDQDPADGRLWYYSATDQVDIMIQNNGVWQGYQNVTNDVRGYNLSTTNPTGPIVSATEPTTQTDEAQSPLVYGDLWIDTSDLENYPVIKRWEVVEGVDQWVTVDNTDQTTENGVLFADARWAPNGTTDPITGAFPTIESLLTSNYLDLDAPEPTLYPQGMLLFNTRRSGFNVKSFQVNYFNSQTFPDDVLPTVTNAWVTASGNKANGSPYMGRQAQRALIVQALKAGIDTNVDIREEQRQFNLIACPQYPELAPNMVALNNERNNTGFVLIDTPLRLSPQEILTWTSNNNGLGTDTGDGLLVGDVYSGAFYPSCQTTDLSGSAVVTAPSHMMLRTIIRNDEVAYPWMAPAGVRRGVVDNAVQIGYINASTGEFQSLGVNQGIRDTLYENRVNPITFIPGVGITNFGNKTTTSVTSALDRINVARLVAYIRGRLETIGKQYLFEPNDQITRNEIKNAIDGLMIDLVAKRGIYDYLVVCDLSNNTPARIDRNELYVDIAIEPVKAVEFIYIPVRIKNTGEISGTAS
jgi:hypothetical protein